MNELDKKIGQVAEMVATQISGQFDESDLREAVLGIGSILVGSVLSNTQDKGEQQRLVNAMTNFMTSACNTRINLLNAYSRLVILKDHSITTH